MAEHLPHGNPTAYQRWEPVSLEDAKIEKPVQLPTAEALEDLHQQAHQEGYDLGYNEGVTAGYQQGRAQAEDELQRLRALLGAVEEAARQLGQATSEELLNLALEIAKQILQRALKVKPELLLPIVRNVMESVPQHSQHPHLHLHPDDAALVKSHMQAELANGPWRIVEDQRIERGGCRIETAVAEVDATLASRWQRLAAALGKDMSWLDDDGPR